MKIKKFTPSGKKPDTGDENEKKTRRNDSDRVNRTVYLTVATLLIILAACVALTSAANRARRGETSGTAEPATTLTPGTQAPTTQRPEVTKPTKSDTNVPETGSDKPVADIVPTFVLPVNGKLGASHDPTTQVFSDTMKDWRVHLGIDIQAKTGHAV